MTHIVKQKILTKPDRILKNQKKNFQNPLQPNFFESKIPTRK